MRMEGPRRSEADLKVVPPPAVRSGDCYFCWRPRVVKARLTGRMRNLCERHHDLARDWLPRSALEGP